MISLRFSIPELEKTWRAISPDLLLRYDNGTRGTLFGRILWWCWRHRCRAPSSFFFGWGGRSGTKKKKNHCRRQCAVRKFYHRERENAVSLVKPAPVFLFCLFLINPNLQLRSARIDYYYVVSLSPTFIHNNIFIFDRFVTATGRIARFNASTSYSLLIQDRLAELKNWRGYAQSRISPLFEAGRSRWSKDF